MKNIDDFNILYSSPQEVNCEEMIYSEARLIREPKRMLLHLEQVYQKYVHLLPTVILTTCRGPLCKQ